MHRLVNKTGTDNRKLIKFLYTADHRSPLEHVSLSMHVRGVSRAFMAQITRHRLASYTCSSQHYQDYSEYPVAPLYCEPYPKEMRQVIEDAMQTYSNVVADGMPKDCARMVLPEAVTVNMIITANAREWAEIMHQRLCKRNTSETLLVAQHMKRLLESWFPELFEFVGPECFEDRCKQGPMSCGDPI